MVWKLRCIDLRALSMAWSKTLKLLDQENMSVKKENKFQRYNWRMLLFSRRKVWFVKARYPRLGTLVGRSQGLSHEIYPYLLKPPCAKPHQAPPWASAHTSSQQLAEGLLKQMAPEHGEWQSCRNLVERTDPTNLGPGGCCLLSVSVVVFACCHRQFCASVWKPLRNSHVVNPNMPIF